MIVKTIQDFFTQKFAEWERSTGSRQNYKNFAAYLGVAPTTLSNWKNDGHAPKGEYLRLVARKLGDEIYEILGEKPPEDVHPFYQIFRDLSSENPGKIYAIVRNIDDLEKIKYLINLDRFEYTIRASEEQEGYIIEATPKKE